MNDRGGGGEARDAFLAVAAASTTSNSHSVHCFSYEATTLPLSPHLLAPGMVAHHLLCLLCLPPPAPPRAESTPPPHLLAPGMIGHRPLLVLDLLLQYCQLALPLGPHGDQVVLIGSLDQANLKGGGKQGGKRVVVGGKQCGCLQVGVWKGGKDPTTLSPPPSAPPHLLQLLLLGPLPFSTPSPPPPPHRHTCFSFSSLARSSSRAI